MRCRNCNTEMKLDMVKKVYNCICGIHTPYHPHVPDEDIKPTQAISVEIPQTPKKTAFTKTQQKKRDEIEFRLSARKKWLDDRCLEETDIEVEKGSEYFTLPNLEGEPTRHTVPNNLTRQFCHMQSGHYQRRN